jgi:hypothetical protein
MDQFVRKDLLSRKIATDLVEISNDHASSGPRGS